MNGMTPAAGSEAEARSAKLEGLGCSRRCVEDARFAQGQGDYVDDIGLQGMPLSDFVRSPYARARVKSVDKAAALAIPGVVAVRTAADLAPPGLRRTPTLAGDGQMVLGDGKALLQGREVAFVLAGDRLCAGRRRRACRGRGRR